MKRKEFLEVKIQKDLWIRTCWNKLSENDQRNIFRFIDEFENSNIHDFQQTVNRLCLSNSPFYKVFYDLNNANNILNAIVKTIPGYYGWTDERSWIHPLDRKKEGTKK